MDVISLTRDLLTFKTIYPPGNEKDIVKFVGEILAGYGFQVEYPEFENSRFHLIAVKGISPGKPSLVLSGHFDTVPLGKKSWNFKPFDGEIVDGKIFGRGSSDMKGALAAMIIASVEVSSSALPEGGLRLIFSAGEEQGCIGISKLVREYKDLGRASAIIVGEPTANLPVIGHKGALYLKCRCSGKTSHSAMPELGINAIYKAALAIVKILNFEFGARSDQLLGYPTINVGTINGGMNINSVPDNAEFTIDIRSTTQTDHSQVLDKLKTMFGGDVEIETLVDVNPLFNTEDSPFIKMVYEACRVEQGTDNFPKSLPYLTDGAVLQRFYNGAPTVILGPGQPEIAHQTDEFCYVVKLINAVEIYKNIISKWSEKND